MSVRLLDAGDCAVTVEFGDRITAERVAQVGAFERTLSAALARGELAGVVELVPTFRSLTVLYDPLQTQRARLDPVLLALLLHPAQTQAAVARRWRLPVCYEPGFGTDLPDVAAATGLSPDEVVQLHSSTGFVVYMLGFMPGFAFMGDLPPVLAVPRRKDPRLRVPAGSVAITGGLSAIYPWESPGGWQLLGRCPVPLFDPAAAVPALLAPGDQVGFEPVSAARFADLQRQLGAGALASGSFMEAA